MTSEQEIIEQLKAGDIRAMEPLMTMHKDYVYTIIIQMVKISSVAQELTQDVFVKVFKKIDTYEEKSKFTTWLYTISYRTCLNYLEKKKIIFNMTEIAGEDDYNDVEEFKFKDEEIVNPLEKFEELEKQKVIWEAIDAIPQQQGIVIALHYLQQFSVKEIADLMTVPENTIKTHLFRGRNAMREFLQKHFSQEELL